jgi:hypothetical protein
MATRPAKTTKPVASTSQEQTPDEMRKELAELRAMMTALMQGQTPVVEQPAQTEKIQMDEYVRVMSLTPHVLNLCTKPYGKGDIFSFKKFGETKQILYKDVVSISEYNRGFLEEGRAYIMDKRVVRALGLDEAYSHILNKKQIEDIYEASDKEIVGLFKSANPKQQSFICEMMINKVRDGVEVDLNVIDALSRASGVKIQEIANNAIEYMEATKKA